MTSHSWFTNIQYLNSLGYFNSVKVCFTSIQVFAKQKFSLHYRKNNLPHINPNMKKLKEKFHSHSYLTEKNIYILIWHMTHTIGLATDLTPLGPEAKANMSLQHIFWQDRACQLVNPGSILPELTIYQSRYSGFMLIQKYLRLKL